MEAGHDFSDRLNPFVVKELRQGLASGSYRFLFLLLPAAIAADTVWAAYSDHAEAAGYVLKGVVFLMLCLVFPLSAFDSLYGERKKRKLELLVTTRLTARSVVYGMWLVRAAQAALLAALAMPGFVLRYFRGGVDMAGELAFVLSVYCASLVLIAGVVFASGLLRETNAGLNVFIRIAVFAVMFWTGLATAGLVFSTGGAVSLAVPAVLAVMTAFAAPVLLFFAEITFDYNFHKPAPSVATRPPRLP